MRKSLCLLIVMMVLASRLFASDVLFQTVSTDFNSDGKTDFADFILFAGAFNSGQSAFDLDGSGAVDFGDFLIFVSGFGSSSGDETNQATRSVTQGAATVVTQNLLDCRGGRVSGVGTITSTDDNVWTVPAETNYTTAEYASDLFNQCSGVMLANSGAVNLNAVPIKEVDTDGEVITAYIFADNYFELYINGTLIAVDPVPFTPFNSNVVRFRVKRPFTIAMKLVDWEENLGLGSEDNRGMAYSPGDGGLVATFHDASANVVAVTDNQWKAQTFYIAPIKDLNCLKEDGQKRLSDGCDESGTNSGSNFYGVHYALPDGWMNVNFDDSAWPSATTYTNQTVGVDNKQAYTNFTDLFDAPDADAQFIWSTNLVLDNEVIVRYTVPE